MRFDTLLNLPGSERLALSQFYSHAYRIALAISRNGIPRVLFPDKTPLNCPQTEIPKTFSRRPTIIKLLGF